MRDPFGCERSVCLNCYANSRECLEFVPKNICADALNEETCEWTIDQNDAKKSERERQDDGGILACISNSIATYEKRVFGASETSSSRGSLTQDSNNSGGSTSLTVGITSGNGSCITSASSSSSGVRKTKRLALNTVLNDKNSLITGGTSGKPAKNKTTPDNVFWPLGQSSPICECGCSYECHHFEIMTQEENEVIDMVRPHFQMLKLSYSVMQSVTDTINLEIPRTEFTYGEIYDVAFLKFLNWLHTKYADDGNNLDSHKTSQEDQNISRSDSTIKPQPGASSKPGTSPAVPTTKYTLDRLNAASGNSRNSPTASTTARPQTSKEKPAIISLIDGAKSHHTEGWDACNTAVNLKSPTFIANQNAGIYGFDSTAKGTCSPSMRPKNFFGTENINVDGSVSPCRSPVVGSSPVDSESPVGNSPKVRSLASPFFRRHTTNSMRDGSSLKVCFGSSKGSNAKNGLGSPASDVNTPIKKNALKSFQSPFQRPEQKEDGTFYDMGCGTGKAVSLATLSRWKFNTCIGIELLPGLYEMGQKLQDSMQLSNTELICGDVRNAIVPDDTRLVYVASTVFGAELMYEIRHGPLKNLLPSCIIITLKTRLPDVEVIEESELLVSWGYSKIFICRLGQYKNVKSARPPPAATSP